MSTDVSQLAVVELDARVATEIMGWRLERTGGEGKYRDVMRWVDASGTAVHVVDWHWRPSTELTDAWQVVEAMRARDFVFGVDSIGEEDESTPWRAWFGGPDCIERDYRADTAPHAICRAALRAAASPKGDV